MLWKRDITGCMRACAGVSMRQKLCYAYKYISLNTNINIVHLCVCAGEYYSRSYPPNTLYPIKRNGH